MTESCCSAGTPSAKLRLYRPLLIVLALSLAGAAVLAAGRHVRLMDGAMGLFLLFLAVPQLGDPGGFARLFAGYDPLARRLRLYARGYPFIAAALGLAYLGGWRPVLVNLAMLAMMTVTACGVAQVLRTGEKLRCACAGTANELPIGWVSLMEYGGMAAMAAINLLLCGA